jgi:hypothetical protein
MADLKPRQYKRLGRIEEKNPERAAKVAGRMEQRATRTERGKAVAEKVSSKNNERKEFAKKTRGLIESSPRERGAMQKFTGRGEAMSKEQFDAKKAELKYQASKKMTGRDTPLSATPEPKSISPFTNK